MFVFVLSFFLLTIYCCCCVLSFFSVFFPEAFSSFPQARWEEKTIAMPAANKAVTVFRGTAVLFNLFCSLIKGRLSSKLKNLTLLSYT